MRQKKVTVSTLICVVIMVYVLIQCVFSSLAAFISPDVPYTAYPTVESCSAKAVDMPKGYYSSKYAWQGEQEYKENFRIVEVDYELSNDKNVMLTDPGEYFFYYYGWDGEYQESLQTLEKEESEAGVWEYRNRTVLPPGEHITYTEYLEVPRSCSDVVVTYSIVRDGEEEEAEISLEF